METILRRLSEPSTYAGLSGLALALGVSNAQWSTISLILAGIAGVAAMLIGEAQGE
jgi:hypothetical protein